MSHHFDGTVAMPSNPKPVSPIALDRLTKIVAGVSLVLLAARYAISESVGFGDAEALYATYALFRQASYLDHPGLIGFVGSLLAGADGTPTPQTAHHFTAVAATTVPWIGGLAARGCGASWRGVMLTILALTVAPEMAIGLFALTPDLPLAACWLGTLGFAGLALRSPPESTRALGTTVAAGLLAGLACMAKISGVLLACSLILTWLSRPARHRLRTIGPYAALVAGSICVAPMLMREWSLGFPMLQHRLLHTQVGFGATARNLGALIGGQLLYVTPFLLLAAILVAADLARKKDTDDVSRLLFWCTFVPFAALSVLTLLSRVAEPHWLAPSYLALAIHFARSVDGPKSIVSRRLGVASVATCLVPIAVVFVLVQFPVLPRIMGKHYEPRFDITNDLYVWRRGANLVAATVESAAAADLSDISVVGPHWVVCAQIQAAMGRRARVGCETDIGDDFASFHPREQWMRSQVILYVTDDRFPVDLARRFPKRSVQSVERVGIRRGGVLVRTIRVVRLGRMGAG